MASGKNASLPLVGVSSSSSLQTWTLDTAGAGQAPSLVVADSPTLIKLLSGGQGEAVATAAVTLGGVLETDTPAVDALLARAGSGVAERTVAVLLMTDAFETAQPILTTTVNVAVAPLARLTALQLIRPALPTSGVVQAQPLGIELETKVVPAGRLSSSVTLTAAFGPLFVTVIEYVTFVPVSTELAEAVLTTARSA